MEKAYVWKAKYGLPSAPVNCNMSPCNPHCLGRSFTGSIDCWTTSKASSSFVYSCGIRCILVRCVNKRLEHTHLTVHNVPLLLVLYILYSSYKLYMKDKFNFDKNRIPFDAEAMNNENRKTREKVLFMTIFYFNVLFFPYLRARTVLTLSDFIGAWSLL